MDDKITRAIPRNIVMPKKLSDCKWFNDMNKNVRSRVQQFIGICIFLGYFLIQGVS